MEVNFLTILEPRDLRSRCWQGWLLQRHLSLVYRWLSSPHVFTWSCLCARICVSKSLLLIRTSVICDSGPPYDIPSRFSHVWLFVTPCTVAHQVPLSTGFSSILACRIPWTESLAGYSLWNCSQMWMKRRSTHAYCQTESILIILSPKVMYKG